MDVYIDRHKRMKTQHEEKASTSMSKVTAFKSTFAGKEVNTGSVIDYSNPFTLPNVLETLDDGKYGSVTKEFEALRAQRIQVINFLSGLQQSCGNSSHNGLNGSKLANIVDLDDDHDTDSGPKLHESLSDSRNGPKDFCVKKTQENDIESPIIIDSDEEDGSHQEESKNPVHPENRTLDFRSWLERSIFERVKQVKMTGQAANDHKFDQTNLNFGGQTAPGTSCEPSIQYQKVVLQKVPENDRLQDVALMAGDGHRGGRGRGRARRGKQASKRDRSHDSQSSDLAEHSEHSADVEMAATHDKGKAPMPSMSHTGAASPPRHSTGGPGMSATSRREQRSKRAADTGDVDPKRQEDFAGRTCIGERYVNFDELTTEVPEFFQLLQRAPIEPVGRIHGRKGFCLQLIRQFYMRGHIMGQDSDTGFMVLETNVRGVRVIVSPDTIGALLGLNVDISGVHYTLGTIHHSTH